MYGSWKLLNNSEAIFPMSHSFTLHKIGFVYGNKRNLERKIFFLHSVSNIYCKSICNIYVHLPTENVMAKMLKRRRSVMKTPLYDPPPDLFQILFNPPPFPVVSNPHLHWSFCCLVSLAEWVITPHLMIDIMDLHMSSLRSLMCVLCNKLSSLMWSDT